LCAYLERHPVVLKGRRVVVAPAANPDGLARNRRLNARGVDLNRNFATRNWRPRRRHGPEPLSEPEARFIADLIRRCRPARIVTIHQPKGCVDWDGPARDLAEAMARACGLPLRKLGAQPGSLGSYAGVDRQIPTITLGLPTSATQLSPRSLWRQYGEALLVAIRFPSPRTTSRRVPTADLHSSPGAARALSGPGRPSVYRTETSPKWWVYDSSAGRCEASPGDESK